MKHVNIFGLVLLIAASTSFAQEYRAIIGGVDSGFMKAKHEDGAVNIELDIKQNGRGPTISEQISLDDDGLPTAWIITGTTTFGSSVDEYFRREGGVAR